MHKNTTALIIAILGYLEINTEVPDISIGTVRSNDYRKISGNDRYANSILAIILEIAIFSNKNR